MKRLITALATAFYAALASATTFLPVQLLNPSGSTSGQTIVSTGASSAPTWSSIGVNGIAAIAANTVLANATGSSASPTAFAMPSCSASSSALGYTTSTGIICNTSINAATLGGAIFAAPGPIGSTTASTGAFTTLSASSTVSGTGFSTYLASPPAIGGTAANTGAFTTLSASGNDALLYQTTNAQSLTSGADTVITNWTKVFDRVNANFVASTGVYTAPVTGFYYVSAGLTLATATTVASDRFQISIAVNGVDVLQGFTSEQAATTVALYAGISGLVQVTAGQTITIKAMQNNGISQSLNPTAINNFISINRVP